jgi:ribosomal protein L12E/L44/L45/RPP1/RPP2
MLAKMTSKNQLTLPKSVTQAIGPAEYFDVQARDGQIVLTPVRIQRGDAVRAKLAELSLTAADLEEAVAWARVPVAAEPAAAYRANPARKPTAKSQKAGKTGKA